MGETISRSQMEEIIASHGLSVTLRDDGAWGTGVTDFPERPPTIHLGHTDPDGDADPMDFFHELSHVLLGHSPQRRGERPENARTDPLTLVEELEAWALTSCLCAKWRIPFELSAAGRAFTSYASPFPTLLKLALAIPGEALRAYMATGEFRPDFIALLKK